MQKAPFTVADYLLTRLKQLNVTEVFQIPGDYVKHFTQALENFHGVTAIARPMNSMLLTLRTRTGAREDWRLFHSNSE
jgi:hypothetical protein